MALQIGHRFSVDLDLFGKRPFETVEILDLLDGIKPLSIITQSKNILILNVQSVKVDFVNYKYPTIASPIIYDSIRLLSPPDIAAMKLAAIAGRGRKRDFYDLYFMLQHYSLSQMVNFYNEKFEDGSVMMVARSLTFFEDADFDEDPRLLSEKINWNEVKKIILQEVKKIF